MSIPNILNLKEILGGGHMVSNDFVVSIFIFLTYFIYLYEVNNNRIMIRPTLFKLLQIIPTPPLITPLLYNSSTQPPKPS